MSSNLIEEFRLDVIGELFKQKHLRNPEFFAAVFETLPDTDDNYDLIQHGYEIFLEQANETDPSFYPIVELFETRLGYDTSEPIGAHQSIKAGPFWLSVLWRDLGDPDVDFSQRDGFPGFTGSGYVSLILVYIYNLDRMMGILGPSSKQVLTIAARNLINDPKFNDNTVIEFSELYRTNRFDPFERTKIVNGESLFFLALLRGRVGIVRELLKDSEGNVPVDTQPDALAVATLNKKQDNWEVVQLLLVDGRFDPNSPLEHESRFVKTSSVVEKRIPLLQSLEWRHYQSLKLLVLDSRTQVSVRDNLTITAIFRHKFADERPELKQYSRLKEQILRGIVQNPNFRSRPDIYRRTILSRIIGAENRKNLHYLRIILDTGAPDVTENNYQAVITAITNANFEAVKLLLADPRVYLPDAFDLFETVDSVIGQAQNRGRDKREHYQKLREIRNAIKNGDTSYSRPDYQDMDRILDYQFNRPPGSIIDMDKDEDIPNYQIMKEVRDHMDADYLELQGAYLGYEALDPKFDDIFTRGDQLFDYMNVITTLRQAKQWDSYENPDYLESLAQMVNDTADEDTDEKYHILSFFVDLVRDYYRIQSDLSSLFYIREYMLELREQQFQSLQRL